MDESNFMFCRGGRKRGRARVGQRRGSWNSWKTFWRACKQSWNSSPDRNHAKSPHCCSAHRIGSYTRTGLRIAQSKQPPRGFVYISVTDFVYVLQVETLLWGQTVSGTVDRQCAHFFRITITEQDLKSGVIISCTSTGKLKHGPTVTLTLKTEIANPNPTNRKWQVQGGLFRQRWTCDNGGGEPAAETQIWSQPLRGSIWKVIQCFGHWWQSQAVNWLTFRYNLSETMPLTMMKRLDDEVPPVFMMLDTYDKGNAHFRFPNIFGGKFEFTLLQMLKAFSLAPTSSVSMGTTGSNQSNTSWDAWLQSQHQGTVITSGLLHILTLMVLVSVIAL